MTIVVDATAIVAIMSGHDGVARIVMPATSVRAPDIAVAEVLNVRWKLRRARLPTFELRDATGFFERIELIRSSELAVDADALSTQLDYPICDCLYVALTKRCGARLVTADRRLARKSSGIGVDVVSFTA